MEDHVATHSIKGFACDKCDYRTTRVMFLRRHMKVWTHLFILLKVSS